MRGITNRLFLTKVFRASSAISATLHPSLLRFIQSGQVIRGFAGSHGSVEGSKTLQDLLQEMESIREDVTSAIEDIEIMADENPVGMVLQDVQSLRKEISCTQVDALEVSKNVLQEMKSLTSEVTATRTALTGVTTTLTGMQTFLKESYKMHRIQFAIAQHRFQKLLDPDGEVLDVRGFTEAYDSDGDFCGSPFNFNSFIVLTLYEFLGDKGVRLPSVVYDEEFDCTDKDDEYFDDTVTEGTTLFHEITVHHIHRLLGSKPRIESNGSSSILFYDWEGEDNPEASKSNS